MLKLSKSTSDPKIFWQRYGLFCGYDNPARNQTMSTTKSNSRARFDSEARNWVEEEVGAFTSSF